MAYSYAYDKGKTAMFAVKEAYRTIRTNLMFSLVKEGCKTIIFTSSLQGEGKTTTAANIAFSLAQSNKKVLLVDLDLRKPRLHRLLKIKNIPGITNYLGGFNTLEEILHVEAYENLDVVTAGTITPNPAEVVSSDVMAKFLEEMRQNYDYIVIDTPPVNIVSDALTLIPHCDGIVFIARYKYTNHPEIKAAVEKIQFVGGKIIGTVVNGTDDIKKSSKYYRRGKYGYKYGYKYKYGSSGYGSYGYGSYGYGGYGGYGYGGYGYGGYGGYGGYDTYGTNDMAESQDNSSNTDKKEGNKEG